MNAELLALPPEIEESLVVEVGEEELVQLHAELQAVVAAGDQALATLDRLCGPNPGEMPQHLRTMLNMGTGYFRHSATTLHRLFRARNTARLAAANASEEGK